MSDALLGALIGGVIGLAGMSFSYCQYLKSLKENRFNSWRDSFVNSMSELVSMSGFDKYLDIEYRETVENLKKMGLEKDELKSKYYQLQINHMKNREHVHKEMIAIHFKVCLLIKGISHKNNLIKIINDHENPLTQKDAKFSYEDLITQIQIYNNNLAQETGEIIKKEKDQTTLF